MLTTDPGITVEPRDKEQAVAPDEIRTTTPLSTGAVASTRLTSIDAFRGLVMFLMLAEVLHLCAVAVAVPEATCWHFLCYQQSHAEWVGCHVHDLIQPSFFFVVGVSVALSVAKRRERGQGGGELLRHAAFRAVAFILLGIALISSHPRQILWKFEDTLTQIGLGYMFLVLIALQGSRVRWLSFSIILVGYWLAFALYPLSGANYDYASVGVTADWLREHGLTGWAAHWQKNANIAWAFDSWFLKLFPHSEPYSLKGLTTLNFIPMLATMILGLAAGDLLRGSQPPRWKLSWLIGGGLSGLGAGWLLNWLGICPIVKPLWTPAWVLFSGGWCLLLLALFYSGVEILGFRKIVLPLTVLGMNSLTAYVISHLYPAFAWGSIRRVVGEGPFLLLGPAYQPLLYGLAVLALYWTILYVMYRQRWFIRL